jgi:hypothetical protein
LKYSNNEENLILKKVMQQLKDKNSSIKQEQISFNYASTQGIKINRIRAFENQ